jgi:hypothetical protein
MKKLLMLVLLMVCVSSLSFSQVTLGQIREHVLQSGAAAGDTIVNSLSDTTAWIRVGGSPYVAVHYTFADRYSVQNVRVDYRALGSTVIIQADTLAAFSSSTDATTTYREVVLRDATKNSIGVVGGTFRIITNFLASGNDTGKKMYIKLLYAR